VVKLAGRGESVARSFWCHRETRDEVGPLSFLSDQPTQETVAGSGCVRILRHVSISEENDA
jgi:hypothetical protein